MKKRTTYGIFATIIMAIFILDTNTMLYGAQEGIWLCLQTIIPALFPFIILSGMIGSALLGQHIKMLRPISRLCHIPDGTESLLFLGFLSGYPVGAQIITQAYFDGSISKSTAKRMLGFCNNAGPSFLFGMFSVIFSRKIILWVLWGIHILSALTVGFIFPGNSEERYHILRSDPISLPTALKKAIQTIFLICGWVIIFRIIICVLNKWLLWSLPNDIQVILSGILELSNGCISLSKIPSEATRFIFASGILSFGGLCVGMQTKSVTRELGCGYYFLGKVLQTIISILFSVTLLPLIFENKSIITYWPIISVLICSLGIIIYLIHRKKLWHLQEECCIIPVKTGRKEQLYAVSKGNAPIL